MPIRVFVDSDVIISSLLSKKGASYFLLHDARLACVVSDISTTELRRVARTLRVPQALLEKLVKTRCERVSLVNKRKTWAKSLQGYTMDENDLHIVAGAKEAKARFLVTYNMKHFLVEKIRDELGITVLPPAFLLQYLRSLN